MQVRQSGTGYMSYTQEQSTGQKPRNRIKVRQSGTEYIQVRHAEVVFRYNTQGQDAGKTLRSRIQVRQLGILVLGTSSSLSTWIQV
jgi:hypothetical protein